MYAWLPTAYKLPCSAPDPDDTGRVAKDPTDKERVATKDPGDMGGDMGRVATGRSTKAKRCAKRAAQSRSADQGPVD